MRLVLTTALVFASGAAFASSITTLGGTQGHNGSIVAVNCGDCPAAPAKPVQSGYKVPELEPGTQKTEIVNIDGQKKLVRTEAWLGGSPVIYVSKLPTWMEDENAIAELHPSASGSTEADLAKAEAASDGIDIDATTSAVEAQAATDAVRSEASIAQPLSLDTFQLRTN